MKPHHAMLTEWRKSAIESLATRQPNPFMISVDDNVIAVGSLNAISRVVHEAPGNAVPFFACLRDSHEFQC